MEQAVDSIAVHGIPKVDVEWNVRCSERLSDSRG